MDEKIELSLNLVNEILGYLDTRPHKEVRRIIDMIHQQAMQSNQLKKKEIPKD